MGFGSYDENEQRDQTVTIDEEAEETNEQRYEGEIEFEVSDSDELLEQFKQIETQES